MAHKSGWMWVSVGMICVIIVASYSTAFYYMETTKYQQLYNDTLTELRKYDAYMFVNVMIDYGNGTHEWHNNTVVPIGADLLTATLLVAQVNYSMGQWGAFVSKINRVGGAPSTFWVYNLWNSTSGSWYWILSSADAYILHEGETFNWVYQRF